MSLEFALDAFPKQFKLKSGIECEARPLEAGDCEAFHEFFLAIPSQELLFLKNRVTERETIDSWCENIDLERNLPLLGISDGKIVACATLHQQHGGWKRHIGRVSALVHPDHRNQGLARALVGELVQLARFSGLEHVEAEFIADQEQATRAFALMGFSHVLRLEKYVKDMSAKDHDYILMNLKLTTDEEYAGRG
jgi:N-acetylglutamate synthase-like GNAT family acetyltransferase